MACGRERRWQEAVQYLWPLVQTFPREQSAPLRFQLALSLLQQEQHEAAETLLSQAASSTVVSYRSMYYTSTTVLVYQHASSSVVSYHTYLGRGQGGWGTSHFYDVAFMRYG